VFEACGKHQMGQQERSDPPAAVRRQDCHRQLRRRIVDMPVASILAGQEPDPRRPDRPLEDPIRGNETYVLGLSPRLDVSAELRAFHDFRRWGIPALGDMQGLIEHAPQKGLILPRQGSNGNGRQESRGQVLVSAEGIWA